MHTVNVTLHQSYVLFRFTVFFLAFSAESSHYSVALYCFNIHFSEMTLQISVTEMMLIIGKNMSDTNLVKIYFKAPIIIFLTY